MASVAMIDGIANPRTRPPLASPGITLRRRMTPTPSRISLVVDSGPIRKDAIATPSVTIAPTERSRVAHEQRVGLAHRHHGQGDGEEEDVGDVPLVHEPEDRDSVYQITRPIRISCSTTGIHRRNRTIFRHLFLSRAGTPEAGRLAESMCGVRSRRALGDALWAFLPSAASARTWKPRHARWPRRCGARPARRRGSPR